jgi:hypothetical protein
MANENKNAPGSQGTVDDRKNVSRQSGNQPHERPDYEEDRPDRPGYDLDVETEIPDGKNAADQPGAGQPGLGSGSGQRPDSGDSAPSRGSRYFPDPDQERQTKKRP